MACYAPGAVCIYDEMRFTMTIKKNKNDIDNDDEKKKLLINRPIQQSLSPPYLLSRIVQAR